MHFRTFAFMANFLYSIPNHSIMVYYFSLRSTTPLLERLTPAEIAALERITVSVGIHLKIELIQNGAILFFDETFSEENFILFKKIFLKNAQIYDADHLLGQYIIWYDSVSKETIYYNTSVEQYIQNIFSLIRKFIGSKQGAGLMEDISRRMFMKSGKYLPEIKNPRKEENCEHQLY
ncbi:MAG: hypothetical protein RBG13Loki_1112 [Promethearchaeota archaeon CR_4]|nr:MAG: hypothetical protein RBG13Loki_1112 [Candidatus Lokiarchaeota archaeon CR_4]